MPDYFLWEMILQDSYAQATSNISSSIPSKRQLAVANTIRHYVSIGNRRRSHQSLPRFASAEIADANILVSWRFAHSILTTCRRSTINRYMGQFHAIYLECLWEISWLAFLASLYVWSPRVGGRTTFSVS